VERVQQQLEPWDSRLKSTGCTVCSDGWSDAVSRPLLNVLAVNAKGPKFVDAINTGGEVKSGQYIAGKLMESIEEIGAEYVVQVRRLW
jgi:hypothetical protein